MSKPPIPGPAETKEALNAPVPRGKESMIGQWASIQVACSGGAPTEVVTSGLDITKDVWVLKFTDGKKGDVAKSQRWIVQDNLVTLNIKGRESTIEARMPSPDDLILRFPLNGVAGDCPANETLVVTYRRAN